MGNSLTDTTVGDQISSNSIFGNQGPAIDLGDAGVISNASAPRQGPNNLQNFPMIFTAADGSLQGWLGGSTPDTTFRIDVFAGARYGPGGTGEAQDYLGSLNVTTDSSGQVIFAVPFTAPAGLPIITATATDPLGNTSDLSAARVDNLQATTQLFQVVPGGSLIFSTASGNGIELLDPDAGTLPSAPGVELDALGLGWKSDPGEHGRSDRFRRWERIAILRRSALGNRRGARGPGIQAPPPGSAGFATLSLSATSEGASPLQTSRTSPMDFSPSPPRPIAVPARSARPSSILTSARPAARTRTRSTSTFRARELRRSTLLLRCLRSRPRY